VHRRGDRRRRGGRGPRRDRTQDQPCDAWSYGDEIFFVGLTPGAAMTIRASAPGFAAKEETTEARLSGSATEIVLARTP
jgi:hypothetical protein